MGMVGGGRDAFIGAVHRAAAQLDGKIELVAGCFSSTEKKSKLSGQDLFLDPKRVYADYKQMAKEEATLPPDQRIDFVSIVTPNFSHVPIATTFLKAGFNIVCDKPLGMSLAEAISFRKLVRKRGKVFAFTHNYTLKIDSVCADLTSFIAGRKLEDDANMLVRFKGGAKGIIYASQISVGEGNGFKIRVYGTKGSIEWEQESPNDLILKYPNKPHQVLKAGWDYLSQTAKSNTRLPAGHPEGFIEAFANIYVEAAKAISDEVTGKRLKKNYDLPTIDDGVLGMAFIDTCIKSSRSNQKWTKFPKV